MQKTIKAYITGILIPLGVGALAALLTSANMDIYRSITKPPLAPPGLLFPIVWTILYTLMGISSVWIYKSETAGSEAIQDALFIYGLQLIVNFLWSIVFFNQNAYLLSFIVLVILWVLILAMILSFGKINNPAALLQIPYLLWVTFAGYLNIMIYLLNR